MLIWVLSVNGVLAGILALLLLTRIVAGRLVLPRGAYLAGALLGFSGWVAFLLSGGSASFEGGGVAAAIWLHWLWVTPAVLPLEAGLLGWVGLRSSWRWCLLAAGLVLSLVLSLLPWVVLLVSYFLRGAAR